jgi:branched-chain amino acid aminotransferase
MTGTAAEVTPVREIDGRQIGQGKPGLITKALQQQYAAVVHGEDDRYRHWLTPVE